jgi:energy-coupling factor transporter ATP-binding protein EcfA2
MIISLKNIQSIREARYEFPETGIVQICGDNSNGKSILFKAISAIVNLKMFDEDERCALINDNAVSGSILIENKGSVLFANLTRERNGCSVTLVRETGEKITRTFRDGGITELIEEFGFRCYDKNNICIQLYETFGPMPFVNTPTSVNGEIVEAMTEDSTAKLFLKNFKEITHPIARKGMKEYNDKISQYEQIRDTITVYDEDIYRGYYEKLSNYYHLLQNLRVVEIEEMEIIKPLEYANIKPLQLEQLNIPPKVQTVDVPVPDVRVMPVSKFYNECCGVKSLSGIIGEMSKIRNGVCPTCGKPLLD